MTPWSYNTDTFKQATLCKTLWVTEQLLKYKGNTKIMQPRDHSRELCEVNLYKSHIGMSWNQKNIKYLM